VGSSAARRGRRSAAREYLVGAGAYVAAAFWLALVWGALKTLCEPETGYYTHLRSWMALAVAIPVMISTMSRWVKYLQLFLGGFIFGALLATVQGRLLNGDQFPRPSAAVLTAVLVGCSLLSRGLARRKLTTLDRCALAGFLAAFVGGIVRGTPAAVLGGLGLGFGLLFIAWLNDRMSSRSNEPARG
jgi:hypothetical protein